MDTIPIQVIAFEDMIKCYIEDFLALSTELGEPMIEFAFMVKDAFDKARMLIEYGLYNSAPVDVSVFFQQQPLSKVLMDIQQFRESNRKSTAFNHLSMISESILALNWFMIAPAPTQFIRDMKDAGVFYGNRVLVSHKGDTHHTNWVNKWTQILQELELYVKRYFLTGFTWGAAQGGMIQPKNPPPPPPPPAPEPIVSVDAFGGAGDARAALISELNQGTGITSRLKPVNKTASKSPSKQADHGKPAAAAEKAQVKVYTPKFFLDGRKWIVEHQEDNPSMTLNNQMSESLVMFRCQKSFLEISNKINNIVIDSCKNVSVIIKGDVISCVELIRCDGVRIQCEGIVPLINCANSDDIQIFVNEKSQKVQLIASKSSSLNMCLMKPDGDYEEFPVPEQIKSVIENGSLNSTVVGNI